MQKPVIARLIFDDPSDLANQCHRILETLAPYSLGLPLQGIPIPHNSGFYTHPTCTAPTCMHVTQVNFIQISIQVPKLQYLVKQ